MEKNHKSESYIIKEAENIIEDFIMNKKEKGDYKFKEKYERLKILSISLGIVGSISVLINIIF